MGLIIWIIIIIWVCVAVSKNKNQKQGGNNAGAGRLVNQPNRSMNQPKRSVNQSNGSMNQGYVNGGNSWADNNRKQQELKARLEKKYKSTAGNYKGTAQKPMGDILERAKASVAEEFSSEESFEAKAVGVNASNNTMSFTSATYQNPKKDIERQKELERKVAEKMAKAEREEAKQDEENTLYAVEDLMIKGPYMELTFERDFLAEGIDMLNRIQA